MNFYKPYILRMQERRKYYFIIALGFFFIMFLWLFTILFNH